MQSGDYLILGGNEFLDGMHFPVVVPAWMIIMIKRCRFFCRIYYNQVRPKVLRLEICVRTEHRCCVNKSHLFYVAN